jgi:hypothetical protein
MMASEGAERILELVNEFGDFPLTMADQLEPQWRRPVTSIDYEQDGNRILIAASDD